MVYIVDQQQDTPSCSSGLVFPFAALAAPLSPPYHPLAFQMWLIKIDGVGHPWMDQKRELPSATARR
jgi:hypothetical protein